MNVHFYLSSPFPDGMAASKRVQNYCRGLMANNHKCSVKICHKYFVKDFDCTNSLEEGIFNGIRYSYIVGKYKANSKLKRIFDYFFLDQIRSSFYAYKNLRKGDIVHCYFYGIFFHFLMVFICKIKQVKIIKEVCEYPYVFGQQGFHNRLLRWVELKLLYPLFDGFVVISTSLEKLADKHKKKGAKIIRVPILVEDFIDGLPFSKPPFGNPFILHTGTMVDQKDGITGILEAFATSIDSIPENVKLVFTGPHSVRPNQFDTIIDHLQIRDRIELKGMVPSSEVRLLQHFAHLTIINKINNLQNRSCFSTKLGEMLMSGTPVITTTIGDAALYLRDGFNAYIVEPDTPEEIASRIVRAFENEQERESISRDGKRTAQAEFDPIFHGRRLSKFFQRV